MPRWLTSSCLGTAQSQLHWSHRTALGVGIFQRGSKSSFGREWTYDVEKQYVVTDWASGLSSVPPSACESCCSHAHLPGRTLKVSSLISPSLLSCSLRCLTLWVDISIWLFYSVLKLDEPHAQLPSTSFLSSYLITPGAVFVFPSLPPGLFSGFLGFFVFLRRSFVRTFPFLGSSLAHSLINQHWGLRISDF